MKLQKYAGVCFVAGLACISPLSSAGAQGPTVQALLGAVKYEDLIVERTVGGETVTIDVASTQPQFGGAWATTPRGERFQVGLECSFLMGFDFESKDYMPSATTRISVDYDIWNFDLAGGLYANLQIGQRGAVRIYAASGPLMTTTLFSSQSYVDNSIGDDQYKRSSENAFGYGLYARTGIEFRVHEAGMLGIGVRSTWIETDLSSIKNYTGLAGFVTYTADL